MFSFGPRRPYFNGKPDFKPSPRIDGPVYIDFTTHFIDDSETDGQAQAVSLSRRLGGVKRVEDPVEIGPRDAGAVVFHDHQNMTVLQDAGDIDLAAIFFQDVNRVVDEIENNLLDLRPRSMDGRDSFVQMRMDGDSRVR